MYSWRVSASQLAFHHITKCQAALVSSLNASDKLGQTAGRELTVEKGCAWWACSTSDDLAPALERRKVKASTARFLSSTTLVSEVGRNSEQLLDSALVLAACRRYGLCSFPIEKRICLSPETSHFTMSLSEGREKGPSFLQ
eukprot:TRINITY_DN9098_c0_g1_i11.p2 TRINITY_DN9098_c0_g1~~TRINITY_DN9098_c0_g1_i11.p2  ORF type:complete len:141 (-),score=16.36 TRINITY_DN9098_c0_g1_i11:2137-2559(-)